MYSGVITIYVTSSGFVLTKKDL